MHSVSIAFYNGQWYATCRCGWMTGGMESDTDAINAGLTHQEAQLN